MVDDQVLLADGGEAIAAMIADALGEARIVRHEFEIGPVEAHQLRQFVERQHAVDQEDFVVAIERALHEAPQLGRHGGFHLETDHRSAPAPLEHGLELAHQIFGLFLDFDFGIADDAERALPLERVAREQLADEQSGELLDGDDARRRAFRGRQPDETIDLVRHADQRVHRLAVAGAHELQRDREAEIGDERERMRRVDRERREQREHLTQEVILQPGLFLPGHIRSVNQRDFRRGELDAQFPPPRLLIAGERRHRFGDACELLGRRETVGASGGDAGAQLAAQAGHAHHEKFIEVVGGDREEPHPLEQGMGGVLGLLEHPAVEVQPGQLTVNETVRARRQRDGRAFGFRSQQGLGHFTSDCNSLSSIHRASQA